jgi:hypothetical protein
MEHRLPNRSNTALKTASVNFLSPEACREALTRFWSEGLCVEQAKDGLIVALPLLYPNGLQVIISIRPITNFQAILTDRGETIMSLETSGVDLNLQRNSELLEEKLKIFELQQSGFELQKAVRLPLDGMDVHLFGEALVSASHLIYRHELATPKTQHVYNAIRGLLVKDNFNFLEQEQAYVIGEVERRIRVDFLITDKRAVACKTVERQGRMREYIEQWGFRWWDAKQHNKKLSRAMFYDPDNQEWDDESLRIGQNVCEIFFPYFEADNITKALFRECN